MAISYYRKVNPSLNIYYQEYTLEDESVVLDFYQINFMIKIGLYNKNFD